MKLVLFYTVTFLAGPALYWALARQTPARDYMVRLIIVAVALVIGSLAIRYLVLPNVPDTPVVGAAGVVALWVAWILVLAFCTLAVRNRPVSGTLKRMAFALGAMATTLPWFGLYTAQIIGD